MSDIELLQKYKEIGTLDECVKYKNIATISPETMYQNMLVAARTCADLKKELEDDYNKKVASLQSPKLRGRPKKHITV